MLYVTLLLQDKQLAKVYNDVTSSRDMSMPVERISAFLSSDLIGIARALIPRDKSVCHLLTQSLGYEYTVDRNTSHHPPDDGR